MSLRSGAAWSAANGLAAIAMPLLVFVVFVRLLPPESIGTVAFAVAMAEMLKMLGLPGLYEAMLARRRQRVAHLSAALGALLVLGALLFAAHAALLSWWLPAEMDPALRISAVLIGLRIPIDLAALQPQAVLGQRMDFRRLALRGILAGAIAAGLGLAVAGLGAPLAGFTLYQIAQSVTILATTVLGTRALLRPSLRFARLRGMAAQGSMASAVRFVAAANNQFDQILLGALLGARQFGLFNLGKRLEGTFITAGGAFSANLFQPVFAAGDAARSLRVASGGLLLLTLTAGMGAAWFAANHAAVVTLVFGTQWIEAAPLAAWLAAAGWVRALGGVCGSWLSVTGRNGALLAISMFGALSGIAITVLVAPHDLVLACALLAGRGLLTTLAMGLVAMPAGRALRLHLTAVALPFALLFGGAWAGRWMGEALFGTAGPGPVAGALALSALGAALAAAPLLAIQVRRMGGPRGLRGG